MWFEHAAFWSGIWQYSCIMRQLQLHMLNKGRKKFVQNKVCFGYRWVEYVKDKWEQSMWLEEEKTHGNNFRERKQKAPVNISRVECKIYKKGHDKKNNNNNQQHGLLSLGQSKIKLGLCSVINKNSLARGIEGKKSHNVGMWLREIL